MTVLMYAGDVAASVMGITLGRGLARQTTCRLQKIEREAPAKTRGHRGSWSTE